MNCPECIDIVEASEDHPHVVRACKNCGRELRIIEPGEHGIGIKINVGDRFVFPSSYLKFSLNPLKTRGQLTRHGIDWYANLIYIDELQSKKETIYDELISLESRYDSILKQSELLKGLDISVESDGDKAWKILVENKDRIEWWANLTGMLAQMAREAIENKDITTAVWAAMFSERARAMLIFKEHIEDVVRMGTSAKRLIDILGVWDSNKNNGNETFWQIKLKENTYALSQIFAVPLVFIQESAYVGGMNIDCQNAKLVDYLFSVETSRDSVLVEIKTPVTKLLGSKYRGTYKPSSELSGALMQALDYRSTLIKNISSITNGTPHDIKAFNPKCVIVIGNGSLELTSPDKRQAFENFRSNSKDIEIVTYDELFRKLEIMANLFSLTRSQQPGPTQA
jgi:Domain of unknown function (DUF4263)